MTRLNQAFQTGLKITIIDEKRKLTSKFNPKTSKKNRYNEDRY